MLEHALATIAAAVDRRFGVAPPAPVERRRPPAVSANQRDEIAPLKVLNSLDEDEFVEQYVRANQPVVVRGLEFEREVWTPEHFRANLGDLPVQVYDTLFDLQEVSTLAQYLDRHFGVGGDYRRDVPYVRWYNRLKDVEHAWGDEVARFAG